MLAAAIDLAAADIEYEGEHEMASPRMPCEPSGIRAAVPGDGPPSHPAGRTHVVGVILEPSHDLRRACDAYGLDLGILISVGHKSTCGRPRVLIE